MAEDITIKSLFKSFKKVQLEKGDVIILTAKIPLSDSAMVLINEEMEEMFPDNKTLILDESLSVKAILSIVKNKTKEEIEKEVKEKIKKRKNAANWKRTSQLTKEEKKVIKKIYKEGNTASNIAKAFGISVPYVYKIVKEK